MINLFVEYYEDPHTIRKNEIILSISHNAKFDYIKNVYILTTDTNKANTYFQGRKYNIIQMQNRSTFQNIFDFANSVAHENDICITMNNDIVLTKNFQKFDIPHDTFYCISRFENSNAKHPFRYEFGDSQDLWAWKGLNRITDANFYYGLLGCDNMIAFLASNVYNKVLNPAYTYKTIHNHKSSIRDGKINDFLCEDREKTRIAQSNIKNIFPTKL